MNRRSFLRRTGALAALPLQRMAVAHGLAQPDLDPNTLARWVDPLPLPPRMESSGYRPDPIHAGKALPFYRVRIEQLQQRTHRDLPLTRVWGFNGSSPGPLFDTRSGEGLIVEWENRLPERHFLPIDHTLCGAEPDKPEVRCVVHLHGGRTPPASDGYPENWVKPGESILCHYPNEQDAALLFYHDHTMGINRLNIYAGLQGLFVIRDAQEEALRLPSGEHEIPLLLYDRFLRIDGQMQYPVSGDPKSPWVPEVYSNVMLANGALFPYRDVEPRLYRLRLMNGSNARFFRLSFGNLSPMNLIGSDQGLLREPVRATRLLLAPAERADVLFDFTPYAGTNVILRSDSFDIMQFRVRSRGARSVPEAKAPIPAAPDAASEVPPLLRTIERIPESRAVKTRRLTLDEAMDKVQQSMGMTLNKTPWSGPVTEKPVLDTTEIWELVNLTEDTHPIHLHLVRFQLLDRRPFDVFEYQEKGTLRFTGAAISPLPEEAGWKDTIRCETGHVTRIIVPFSGYAGRYVWHCHILEHEDNEMMRPFEVCSSFES